MRVCVVFDHPGCAASVASRLFLTGAATPPHEEGNVRWATLPLAYVSYSRNGSMLFVAQSTQRSESLLDRIVPGMATTDPNMVPEPTIRGKDHTWNDADLVR